jgi:hypothetical protein
MRRYGRDGASTAEGRRMILGAVAVKIAILVVATIVFIVVYGYLTDYLQRRGP